MAAVVKFVLNEVQRGGRTELIFGFVFEGDIRCPVCARWWKFGM